MKKVLIVLLLMCFVSGAHAADPINLKTLESASAIDANTIIFVQVGDALYKTTLGDLDELHGVGSWVAGTDYLEPFTNLRFRGAYTVAELLAGSPATPLDNDVILIYDGDSACDQSTGSGTAHAWFRYDTAAWVCINALTENIDYAAAIHASRHNDGGADEIDRGTEGITIQIFGDADATPDVTNGGTEVHRLWRVHGSSTPTITDFDDTDDHSEFVNGDWFLLYVDYPAVIDFTGSNIEGNAGVTFTGLASTPVWLKFTFIGSAWQIENFNVGMSDPLTLSVGSVYQSSTTISTAEGVHDGADDAATLTDSGETFPTDAYIGMTLYNVTDGSSCTVTDNNGTTMTCTLAGGTGNDWDTNDVWAVAPGPNQSGMIFYITAATTILHPATVNYICGYYSTGANVVKVDPQSASMEITLYGTGITAGDEIDSPGAAANFIWLHNVSATSAFSQGSSGTWVDGGAS